MATEFIEPTIIEKIACKAAYTSSILGTVFFGSTTMGYLILAEAPWQSKVVGGLIGAGGAIYGVCGWMNWEIAASDRGLDIGRWPLKGWELPGARMVRKNNSQSDSHS